MTRIVTTALLSLLVAGSAMADPTVGVDGQWAAGTASASLEGDILNIDLGGTRLKGVEPDEIDVTVAAPMVLIEGLTLRGVESEDLDFAADGSLELDSIGGVVELKEHILLSRSSSIGHIGTVELTPVSATLTEVVTSWRPYDTALVMDIILEVTDIVPDEAGFEAQAIPVSDLTLPQGTALMPEMPICAFCSAG